MIMSSVPKMFFLFFLCEELNLRISFEIVLSTSSSRSLNFVDVMRLPTKARECGPNPRAIYC